LIEKKSKNLAWKKYYPNWLPRIKRDEGKCPRTPNLDEYDYISYKICYKKHRLNYSALNKN
jgi:hypothetical protein